MAAGLTGVRGKTTLHVELLVEKEPERKYVTENAPIQLLNMADKTVVQIRQNPELLRVQWTRVPVSWYFRYNQRPSSYQN